VKKSIVNISLIFLLVLLGSCDQDASNPVGSNYSISWVLPDSGLPSISVKTLAASGSNLIAGTFGRGIFLSTDKGTHWNQVGINLWNAYNVYAITASGRFILAGTQGGGVFRSTDNGVNWSLANYGMNGRGTEYVYTFATSDTYLLAGTEGNGVYISEDYGGSWKQVNNGLSNLTIQSLAISGSNFITVSGNVEYFSTNNGENWNAVNTGLSNGYFTTFIDYNSQLFAGTNGGGIYLSKDNGTSWNAVNSGLTSDYSKYVSAFASYGSYIFAGTYGGVFLSTNNGASWINIGLINTPVMSLIVLDNILFAGTSKGVWKSVISFK
jgi:photosystem II stability/assembly factor-like uncharacterized protein